MIKISEPIEIIKNKKVIIDDDDWRNDSIEYVKEVIETSGVVSRLSATEYRDFGISLSSSTVKVFLKRDFSEDDISTGDIIKVVETGKTYKVFSVTPAYSESVLPKFYEYNVTVMCERVS